MIINNVETFDKLLVETFRERNSITLFVRENYPELDSKAQATKIRNIRRYVAGTNIPSFVIAKELCEKIGIEISGDMLNNILEYSKMEKDIDIRYHQNRLIDRLNIKYDEIFLDKKLSVIDKDNLFSTRVKEVCGDSNAIKEYVIKLIENDIDNEILE